MMRKSNTIIKSRSVFSEKSYPLSIFTKKANLTQAISSCSILFFYQFAKSLIKPFNALQTARMNRHNA